MKIAKIDVLTILAPRPMPRGLPKQLEKALATPLPVVVVRMATDSGIEGIGYTISLNLEFQRSLAALTQELAALLIGEDPLRPEYLSTKLLYPANWIGPGGLLNIAAAALDIAVWDIIGKNANQPLWQLLGGASDQPRVYDSGSLLADNIDELQRAAEAAVKAGHRAIKMRPGDERHGRIADVAARVRAVREAIGDDIDLMYDINQTWTPSRAIRVGRALEEFELAWLEDPTSMHDIAGQASIAKALDTPICSGEYHYDSVNLLRLLEARAVDYLMVDLLRMGGITQFRKVAGLAEAFGVPVASHLIPEVFAHCIAAAPNGLIVEGMPWTAALFHGVPEVREGRLELGARPGHGLELDEAFIQKHRAG